MKILEGVSANNNSYPFHPRHDQKRGTFDKTPKHVTINNWPASLAYDSTTLFTRKPDIPFYCSKINRGPMDMVMVVNVKPTVGKFVPNIGCVSQTFSDDALGELRDCLLKIYEVQPFRPFVIGALTDSRNFQFMKMTRGTNDTYPVCTTSMYCGPEGLDGWQVRVR
jgi:hypothetical protein